MHTMKPARVALVQLEPRPVWVSVADEEGVLELEEQYPGTAVRTKTWLSRKIFLGHAYIDALDAIEQFKNGEIDEQAAERRFDRFTALQAAYHGVYGEDAPERSDRALDLPGISLLLHEGIDDRFEAIVETLGDDE